MSDYARRLAAAAEGLVGTPYRLYGRDPATGLDCVGLVLRAIGEAGGHPVELPPYGLRNLAIDGYLEFAAHNGFAPRTGSLLAGDLLLVRTGPAQHHLLIATGKAHLVHAHLGLRKVVSQPGIDGWAIAAHWYPREQE
ncbi:NlpC/P60 family protein [Qipengyuania sp.]|uniref:NlpC/P60 family protein n=1 Tax=Qipengyuania sp. TaxID=2004515 RepID=UPI00373699C7